MKSDISKVIEMIQEDRIDADEAEKLLNSLKTDEPKEDAHVNKTDSGRKVKVRIQSDEGENVNVNLPVWLVKSFLKMGHGIASSIPQARPYADEIDVDRLVQAIDQDQTGKIVDIQSNSGDTVMIYIE